MGFKHHLGRIAIGVAGAIGTLKGMPPEKNPAMIEAKEKGTDEEQHTDSSGLSSPRPPSISLPAGRHGPLAKWGGSEAGEGETNQESNAAKATREIEGLPTNLPPLRGMRESLEKKPTIPEQKLFNPYANLDSARAFVVGIFGNLGKRCVDRSAIQHPENLPENTFAIQSEEIKSYEDYEQSFRVAVNAISDNEWEELLSLMFYPQKRSVEMIPEPELSQIVDPISVSGNEAEMQKQISNYIALLQIARAYLNAGLTGEEIKSKLEERAKKNKKEIQDIAQR